MNRLSTVARLRSIAQDVRRLRPDWSNPERYFEQRDDLDRELRRLATDIENSNRRESFHG